MVRFHPMQLSRNFRFLNDRLNCFFIHLMLESGLRVNVDDNGVVYFDPADEGAVEDLLAKIRGARFDDWQILSCPVDWVNKYRQEMKQREVPYIEELNDGQVEFLLPQKYDPHEWQFTSG